MISSQVDRDMKLNYNPFNFCLTLLAASLLASFVAADALQMKPTYRDLNGYKNIIFSATIGGSSHYNWVLEISDELARRGHNVTFISTADDVRFGKPYSNVQSFDLGPGIAYDEVKFMLSMCEEEDAAKFMAGAFGMMTVHYERDFHTLSKYFKDNKVDLALCDHFVDGCIDAANANNIPYIITLSMDLTTESATPYINNEFHNMDDFTTEFQGFTKRFKNRFVAPFTTIYTLMPHIKEMIARKRAIGVEAKFETPSDVWKDSVKLINNLFGFGAPRPVGPMAEYVGPIMPKKYAPLTEDLEEYLNAHERVAYIAFGQVAVPSEEKIKFILRSLFESIESGSLDGFLWATVNFAGLFPESITTSSGTTYNVQDMFNRKNTHTRMIKWAPQKAVLLHPSTALFISHGGQGSWYESMYTGTPMILFPFFGDQPGNALIIERNGLGGILKKEGTFEEAAELFKKVTTDEGGIIKANIRRMQALTQIHSDHGVLRGADVVEEVAYTHINGKLPHRESADRRMSYIKSHNLDLYAALLLLVVTTLGLIISSGVVVYKQFSTKTIKEKLS